MKDKVLLVEDLASMRMIVSSLIAETYDLVCATTLAEADAALLKDDFSLILLDVVLPDGDGFQYCEKIRQDGRHSDVPLVFLTSKTEIDDRVRGLNLGADDYIMKPVEPREFVARVRAKIRRQSKTEGKTVFSKALFSVDMPKMRATMKGEDGLAVELGLTPIEFKILVHLMRNEEKIIAREDLMSAVWGGAVHLSTHTVQTHISSLRKKVGTTGRKYLKSIVKKGYQFTSKGVK